MASQLESLLFQDFYHNIYLLQMKHFKVLALSSKGQFILQDGNSTYEYPIEGFRVANGIQFRHHFSDFIGKTIDCTINKTATHIRYLNQQFLSEKLSLGALQIVQKQFQESKIYSTEQKSRMSKVEITGQNSELKIVDLTQDRKAILKYFPRPQELTASLQYLNDEVVVSFGREGELVYVPVRLRNITVLFACLPQKSTGELFLNYPKLKINCERPIYNLVTKRFEIMAEIEQPIELMILRNGWGIINPAALAQNSKSFHADEYLTAQSKAKEQHLGIYSRNTEILGFIYAKNNFVGQISDVLDGYIFEVVKKTSGQKLKIELAMVRCPVGDEAGAFKCRQFARKQLIGQQVNIYLHKDSGLNITGSIIRARDSKDVQSMMIEQGWGFVREQFLNSILCLKLNQFEKRSKEKGRGLHSKDIGMHRSEDLTVPNTQKEEIYVYRRLEILKKLGEVQTGVIEGMYDILNYRVWLEDKNVVLKVKLEGIIGNNINPLLQEVKKIKEDSKQFYERKLKKRSVTVRVVDYQKENNYFLGTVTLSDKRDLQEVLLEESFVYADKQNGAKENYILIEQKAKQGGIGIWSPSLIKFEPINPLDLQSKQFKGKFSWVEDGETIFIQPESSYKTLEKITDELTKKNLKKVGKEQIIVGALYVAPYFGQFYRAFVMAIKGKKVKVLFIDWGNRQTVEETELWQMPESLKFIEKQCLKAKLFMTKPIRNQEYLERLREQLMDSNEYQFKKEQGDFLSCYKNKQYINLSLIERGIVKSNTAMTSPEMTELIRNLENDLYRNKVGVWEYSDEEEIEQEIEEG